MTFIYLGIDIFQKKKPSSYISIEKNLMPSLDVSELFYAIQMTDTYFNPIKEIERKFEYVFQVIDGRANPPTFKNYEMVPCSQNSFYNKTNKALFTNWKFKTGNFFCIPDNLKYTIQGNNEDGFYSFASIFIQYYYFKLDGVIAVNLTVSLMMN
jgi:hypothetical protein